MSILFVHASPAAIAASLVTEYVIAPEVLPCCYEPAPFLAGHLESRGLRGFKAIPEVIDVFAEDIEKCVRKHPILRGTLLAHSKSVISEIAHLNPRCSRLIRARERFLADPTVRGMLDRRPGWELDALVAAAAIELNLPVLGFSKFYRAYAEHHPISAGVRDPRDGAWIIPPAA